MDPNLVRSSSMERSKARMEYFLALFADPPATHDLLPLPSPPQVALSANPPSQARAQHRCSWYCGG